MWTAVAEHVGQLRAVPDVEHPATHGRPLWPKLVLSLWYATAAILLGGGIGLVVGTIGKKDVSSLSLGRSRGLASLGALVLAGAIVERRRGRRVPLASRLRKPGHMLSRHNLVFVRLLR